MSRIEAGQNRLELKVVLSKMKKPDEDDGFVDNPGTMDPDVDPGGDKPMGRVGR